MKEWAIDYYEKKTGCCLHCPNSSPGCLCLECNCTKCYWYSSPQENQSDKGSCDKVIHLKKESKEKAKEMYEKIQLEKNKQYELFKEENNKREKEIKESGEIPNYYTCKKCKREFCSKEIFNIQNKEPLCYICQGEKDGN
jgi:hypothetical protein